jgi:hypothetical protein
LELARIDIGRPSQNLENKDFTRKIFRNKDLAISLWTVVKLDVRCGQRLITTTSILTIGRGFPETKL